jgi:hypothetical protein
MSEAARVSASIEEQAIAVRVWTTRARRGRRADASSFEVAPLVESSVDNRADVERVRCGGTSKVGA